MKEAEFDYLRKLLYDRSGLVITKDKSYLIESRLRPLAREYDYDDVETLVGTLYQLKNEKMISEVVDAMTTNETLFFRDSWPFQLLRNRLLPNIILSNSGVKRIRIWSAACSSGQEPYSIAMTVAELGAAFGGAQVEICATDISPTVLERAKQGRYSEFELSRGLPEAMRSRYFVADGGHWRVRDALREMVTFRSYNLLDDPLAAGLGTFDIVFCRNVLIYFDEATRRRVLQGLTRVMSPGGYLCLGGAETVVGISDSFQGLPGERRIFELSPKRGAAKVA
ncbi:MAG: chemotaxis protein CheR [Alphaproteobacteria bacterium HGW-Alphaproteobacteria-5]|nr:MAG: chemotaxis protein CheR [Alphaproteobacteria bacterium HGW-Alphaproteobacteria-5]